MPPVLVVRTRSPGDSSRSGITIGPDGASMDQLVDITVADKVFKSDASYDSAK